MKPRSTPSSPSEEAFVPVAVIGLALRLPGADTEEQLHQLLVAGRHVVDVVPRERLELAGLDPEGTYPLLAALSGIEEFDHACFGISPAEAVAMDPHQRLALQLTHAAMENAARPLAGMRGTDCGVFFAAPRPGYVDLVGEDDLVTMLGTQPSALAGRIAHQLGLQGPAVVVDTGCSSALVALQYACRELAAGSVDAAVVGAVSLFPTLFQQSDTVQEVVSESGTCRAFDASADGTAPGEGGVVLLVKRLDRALADQDPIHAVIRSVAVNHNGDRSNGFSAPGPVAQAEVIERAWGLAGLATDRLTYLEGHGSGTRLGDMIEIESAQRVLRGAGASRHACDIGSVKSNMGHLGNAAGLAGLLKAVLAVKHGTRYASINVDTPNPQFAAHGEPLRVRTVTEAWQEPDGRARVAGVSSFTLIGTNAHAVVEQPPLPGSGVAASARTAAPRPPLTVSAPTRAGLRRQLAALADHLATVGDDELPDVLFSLNVGRDLHPYRVVLPATGDAAALRSALVGAAGTVNAVEPAPARRLVLLLTDPGTTAAGGVGPGGGATDGDAWLRSTDAYRRAWSGTDQAVPDAVRHQYAIARAVCAAGAVPALVAGLGAGRAAARALRGELSLAEAWAQQQDGAGGPAVEEVVERLRAGEPTAFRVLGRPQAGLDALGGGDHDLAALEVDRAEDLSGVVGALVRAGVAVDWRAWAAFVGAGHRRVALPGYVFEPTRLWPAVARTVAAVPGTAAGSQLADPGSVSCSGSRDVTAGLIGIFEEVLRLTGVGPESDYFDLGGNSILAISLLERIRTAFGTRIELPLLYEHSTVRRLARLVTDADAAGPTGEDGGTAAIARLDSGGPFLPSHGQEAIWFLERLHPGLPMYTVPHDIHLRGPVDADALRWALARLEERHAVLRSRFVEIAGEPRIMLRPVEEDGLEFVDLSGYPGGADARLEHARELIRERAARPMDMATDRLYRKVLFRLAPDDHILLLHAHHAVVDGHAPAIVDRDLWEFYNAACERRAPSLPELPVGYLDFAAWQRRRLSGQRLERLLAFWRGRVRGVRPSALPTTWPRPAVSSGRGEVHRFTVPAGLVGSLRAFAQEQRGTLFMTVLTALKTLMVRYGGEGDVTVGTTTVGRQHPDLQQIMGYFNNAVPLRTDLGGDPSFRGAFARVRRSVIDGLANDELPFAMLVADAQEGRDPSRHPIFQVGYSHQTIGELQTEPAPGLSYRTDREQTFGGMPPGTAKWDLTLTMVETADQDHLEGAFEYSTDLFDAGTVAAMAEAFVTLLASVCADPDVPLSGQALLPAGAAAAVPVLAPPPAAPAPVQFAGRFAGGPELGQAVARVAAAVRSAGVGVGDVVGVDVADADAPAVVLGVLAAGGVCVPADPGSSFAGRAALFEQAGPCLVVCGTEAGAPWPGRVLTLAQARAAEPLPLPGWPDGARLALPQADGRLVLFTVDQVAALTGAGDNVSGAPAAWRAVASARFPGTGPTGGEGWTRPEPWPGTGFQVLDTAGRPQPVGVPGELFLVGAGAGAGFLDAPAAPGAVGRAAGRRGRITATGAVEVEADAMVVAEPPEAAAQVEPAGCEVEAVLRVLFAEVLGRDEVGREEDFFKLGGHSLSSMRLLGRVGRTLGVRLAAGAVFENPTVAGLAAVVRAAGGRAANGPGPAATSDDAAEPGRSAAEAAGRPVRVPGDVQPGQAPAGAGSGVTVRPFRLPLEESQLLGWRPGDRAVSAGAVVAAVALLVAELTGERELVIGLRRADEGGLVPVGVRVAAGEDFAVLVARTARAVDAAGPDPQAVFSVAVELGERQGRGLDGESGRLDLVWRVRATDEGLAGALLSDPGRFHPRTAKEMVGNWRRLLRQLGPGVPAPAEPPTPASAPVAAAVSVSGPVLGDAPGGSGRSTLSGLVGEACARFPDRTAVVFGDAALTYRELDARAAVLAGRLRARGVGRGSVVAVCMERRPELPVALLAVLYVGAAYLPLDPGYPGARLGFMLADSGAVLLLTAADAGPVPGWAGDVDRLMVGLGPLDTAGVPATHAAQEARAGGVAGGVDPQDLAYVIYTSGSTGRPKGVGVPHEGIANSLRWLQRTSPLSGSDRVLQKIPTSFDFSVWELFWPLTAGATVVLAAAGTASDVFATADAVAQQQITTAMFVPSVLRVALAACGPGPLSGLRRILLGGEELDEDLRAELRVACPDAEVFNLYGPTEASVGVSAWDCRRDSPAGRVPIGRAVDGLELLVLDEDLTPCAAGRAGELYIGGVGLARGYAGRAALTAERFVAWPGGPAGARLYRTGDLARTVGTEGDLEYLGRADDQVKLRGLRIELGEVEAVLRTHPGVAAAAVTVRRVPGGDGVLQAHLVAGAGGGPVDEEELRGFLAGRLPAHMVPGAFMWRAALPLAPSGKLARGEL